MSTKPPTITSSALPPSQQPGAINTSPAQVVDKPILDRDIVAKPLRSPNFLNLKPKNPNMSLYFGNRAVGEKESGMRYDELIAKGFRPAKPEEVLTNTNNPVPASLCRDGRIMYGDLILLIMPRVDYVGSQKWNAETAALRVRKFGSGLDASGERANPQSALSDISNSKAAREGKVKAYIPPLAELDSKTADNSGIPANLAEK